MKSAVFWGLIIAAVLIAQANADCEVNGTILKTGEKMPETCGLLTCLEDGGISGVGCGMWDCPEGKRNGTRFGDKTKVYPDCCDWPICID